MERGSVERVSGEGFCGQWSLTVVNAADDMFSNRLIRAGCTYSAASGAMWVIIGASTGSLFLRSKLSMLMVLASAILWVKRFGK